MTGEPPGALSDLEGETVEIGSVKIGDAGGTGGTVTVEIGALAEDIDCGAGSAAAGGATGEAATEAPGAGLSTLTVVENGIGGSLFRIRL